jgi:chitodextrinase
MNRYGSMWALLVAALLAAAPAAAQSIPAWQTSHHYAIGDLVTYNGVTYQALQAETSISTWTPAATPALWQAIDMKGAGSCAAVPPAPTALASPISPAPA